MKYLTTIRDKVMKFCTACGQVRYVYVCEDEAGDSDAPGERITACCVCQRILLREHIGATE
jgi:hypothetical protein